MLSVASIDGSHKPHDPDEREDRSRLLSDTSEERDFSSRTWTESHTEIPSQESNENLGEVGVQPTTQTIQERKENKENRPRRSIEKRTTESKLNGEIERRKNRSKSPHYTEDRLSVSKSRVGLPPVFPHKNDTNTHQSLHSTASTEQGSMHNTMGSTLFHNSLMQEQRAHTAGPESHKFKSQTLQAPGTAYSTPGLRTREAIHGNSLSQTSIATTRASGSKDAAAQLEDEIGRLQAEVSRYTHKLHEEKQRSEGVKSSTEQVKQSLISVKQQLTGSGGILLAREKIEREISRLEKALQIERAKLNDVVGKNSDIKANINELRMEKVAFRKAYARIQSDLSLIQEKMNILVNQANTSHAGQVAAEEKMASLEREAEEALASYQSRKRELDHELQAGQKMLQKSLEMIAKVTAIAHSHSQFQRALVDNMNHRGQSKEPEIKLKSRSPMEKSKNAKSTKQFRNFYEAFDKIKEETHIESPEKFVQEFIESEAESMSMIRRVNVLGEEAEGLNQEIQTLEREIDASMKAAQLEHRRKRFAQDLTDNITKSKEKIKQLKIRLEDLSLRAATLKAGVASIYVRIMFAVKETPFIDPPMSPQVADLNLIQRTNLTRVAQSQSQFSTRTKSVQPPALPLCLPAIYQLLASIPRSDNSDLSKLVQFVPYLSLVTATPLQANNSLIKGHQTFDAINETQSRSIRTDSDDIRQEESSINGISRRRQSSVNLSLEKESESSFISALNTRESGSISHKSTSETLAKVDSIDESPTSNSSSYISLRVNVPQDQASIPAPQPSSRLQNMTSLRNLVLSGNSPFTCVAAFIRNIKLLADLQLPHSTHSSTSTGHSLASLSKHKRHAINRHLPQPFSNESFFQALGLIEQHCNQMIQIIALTSPTPVSTTRSHPRDSITSLSPISHIEIGLAHSTPRSPSTPSNVSSNMASICLTQGPAGPRRHEPLNVDPPTIYSPRNGQVRRKKSHALNKETEDDLIPVVVSEIRRNVQMNAHGDGVKRDKRAK